MNYFKNLIVVILPLFFAISCVHVHAPGDPYESRDQRLESGQSCKSQCKEDFHSCKANRTNRKGGASKCAHQKNACMSRCKG